MLQGLLCRDALDGVALQEVLEAQKEGVAGSGRAICLEPHLPPAPLLSVTCSRSLPVALSLGTTFTRDVVAGYIG